MNNEPYKVQWTLPYQPDHVDRHELADDDLPLCWVLIQKGLRRFPIACFRRVTDEETLYEPVYLEFSPKTVMPYLELVDPPFDQRDEYELVFPLPDRLPAKAIGDGGDWFKVEVKPVLAKAELYSYGGECGLAVAYALCDVVKETEPEVLCVGDALYGRLRQILTERGEIWEPFFYAWSQS